MATDAGVGDREVARLQVQPGDGTTAGTLTVHAPDGTSSTVNVTATGPDDGVVTLTSDPITYTQPGRWVLHWEVTGTGASAEDLEVYVVASPVAGGPEWIPGRSRVANYVPLRTLERDSETHDWTFTANTFPTGVTVDRLIADAVEAIHARVGEVAPALHGAASVVAAKLAACAVERGYPAQQSEQSLTRARDICDDAAKALDDLAAANRKPDDPGNAANPLPLYDFPDSPPWGDHNLPMGEP
jgi:hypothetical protein